MKKQTIIIIIMGLIILSGAGVYGYNYITEKAYDIGVQDAVLLINEQMLDTIYQQGYIPYIIPVNETASMKIKLVPTLYETNTMEIK